MLQLMIPEDKDDVLKEFADDDTSATTIDSAFVDRVGDRDAPLLDDAKDVGLFASKLPRKLLWSLPGCV